MKNLEYFRHIKLLYQAYVKNYGYNSVIGAGSSFLNPLLTSGAVYFIFNGVLSHTYNSTDYFLFTLSGYVFWNFFSLATNQGTSVLRHNNSLIKANVFYRETLIIGQLLAFFIQHLCQILLLILFLFFLEKGNISSLLIFPLLEISLFLIIMGTSLILAIVGIFLRDFGYIWNIITRIGLFLTPVFYEKHLMPPYAQYFINANPLAQLLDFWRLSILNPNAVSISHIFYILVFSILFLIVCLKIFRSTEKFWVEHV